MTFRDPGTPRRSVSWDDAASDTGRGAETDTVRDPAVRALEQAVEGLCAQLDRAEQWAVALRAELATARAAERKAVELVKYFGAAASGLRQRADCARRSGGAAGRVRRPPQWGLRRRLRWALSRKR